MTRAPKTKNSTKGDPESDLREILRQFARKVLNSQKLRETAAKKIGSKPSYVRAMLDQRGVGGLDSWASLMVHCFDNLNLDLRATLERALESPERLKDGGSLTPSEVVFRNLGQIAIVNEDVKFQLATHLEKMLMGVEKNLANRTKRT